MLPPRLPDRRPLSSSLSTLPRPAKAVKTERDAGGRLLLKPQLRVVDRERAVFNVRLTRDGGSSC